MASLENHRKITYDVLIEYKFSTDIANAVSYYTSIYADNPGEYGVLKGGDSAVYGTKANNFGHIFLKLDANYDWDTLSYNCLSIKPLKKKSKSIDSICPLPVEIDHSATKQSQHDTIENVQRHGMSTSNEFKERIDATIRRVNISYESQLSDVGIFYLKKNPSMPFSTFAYFKIHSNINAYNSVLENEINRELESLKYFAIKRGLNYGWDNIFEAINIGKIDDIKLDKSNSDHYTIDALGTSILAKLGVGIHALQDSKVHGGESMYEYNRLGVISNITHGMHDVNLDKDIQKDMLEITKGAIIAFCVMKGDNNRLSKLDYNFLEKNLNNWSMPSKYQTEINIKITKFKVENFQPIKLDSTAKRYV